MRNLVIRSSGQLIILGFTGFIGFAGFLGFAAPAHAAPKAIKAARVIDPSGRAIANAVVVVDGGRIVSVGTAAPPPGAEVIDLGPLTLIPGLIDLHTHMTYYWDRTPG